MGRLPRALFANYAKSAAPLKFVRGLNRPRCEALAICFDVCATRHEMLSCRYGSAQPRFETLHVNMTPTSRR